jgi:hypothetical protein
MCSADFPAPHSVNEKRRIDRRRSSNHVANSRAHDLEPEAGGVTHNCRRSNRSSIRDPKSGRSGDGMTTVTLRRVVGRASKRLTALDGPVQLTETTRPQVGATGCWARNGAVPLLSVKFVVSTTSVLPSQCRASRRASAGSSTARAGGRRSRRYGEEDWKHRSKGSDTLQGVRPFTYPPYQSICAPNCARRPAVIACGLK